MKITFYGHSCIGIEVSGKHILVDPFITANDNAAHIDVNELKADYIFEPNKEVLLEKLIPSILQVKFLKYTLDTNASEHGARMTAMHKATDNATEHRDALKLQYNKARQARITIELVEIISGASCV